MVYIAHSANDLASSPSLSNVPWTQDAATKDVLLGVCVTVGGVFTLFILLTFTSCCCRKRKSNGTGSESEDAEENGQIVLNNKRKDPLRKAPSSSGLDSPTEGSSSLKQLDIRKSCPNFQDVETNSMSVKDRIKAFEFYQNEKDVKLRDGSKPKRKKPTSRAFDEFESQGILIGFGGNQRRKTTSTEGLTQDSEEEFKDYHQLPPIPKATPHLHQHQSQERLSNQQQNEEKTGSADEFEAVQRDTDILKSFRRAPPPKNRTRARRSGRRRPPGANEGVESIAEDEEKEFESSLHMQPATPQSNERTTKAINRLTTDTTDSLNCGFGVSPPSQRGSMRSQRGTTSSHFSDLELKQSNKKEQIVDFNKDFDSASTIRSRSFSEGLSSDNNANSIQQKQSATNSSQFPQLPNVDPFKYSLNPANVTLSSLRRDLPISKKLDVSHNGNSNSHKSSTENWSPQPQRPVSVIGVPMRRWASDHYPSGAPRDGTPGDGPPSPLLDRHPWSTPGTNNNDTTNLESSVRKCRYDEREQERIYPKSEKLLRKAIGSIPGNFPPPPNLLYRPYYHTSNNVSQEHQLSNNNKQYQCTRSESWAGNASSMIVHFNIDTEPTNV